MIHSISHITFAVNDIKKTALLFKNIFDAKLVYASDDNEFSVAAEKFFIIGNVWVAIMQIEDEINRSYNHVAFKIDEADFELYQQKLVDHNIEMLPPRPRVDGEGRSLYFYDYDNHLFELHTGTLELRLQRYALGK